MFQQMKGSMAPLIVVYILIAAVTYAFFALAQMENVDFWVELVRAAPFGFSALILGTFSVLFWALNYLSRNHRSNLGVQEARALFEERSVAINKALEEHSGALSDKELTLLKAHLLFCNQELSSSPETPTTGFSLNYTELVSQIIRRS